MMREVAANATRLCVLNAACRIAQENPAAFAIASMRFLT
jgi:hypothetical protein